MRIETERLVITGFTMDMAEAVHRNSLDADNLASRKVMTRCGFVQERDICRFHFSL